MTNKKELVRSEKVKIARWPSWGRARCLSDVACGLTAICCCARRSWIPAAPRRRGRQTGVEWAFALNTMGYVNNPAAAGRGRDPSPMDLRAPDFYPIKKR